MVESRNRSLNTSVASSSSSLSNSLLDSSITKTRLGFSFSSIKSDKIAREKYIPFPFFPILSVPRGNIYIKIYIYIYIYIYIGNIKIKSGPSKVGQGPKSTSHQDLKPGPGKQCIVWELRYSQLRCELDGTRCLFIIIFNKFQCFNFFFLNFIR